MTPSDFTAAASRLCLACGMCCNGVLFHIVRLQPEDSATALEKLGLKIRRKKREPYFTQPCEMLHGCSCSIYAARPTRCGLFECRQLKDLNSGQTSELEVLQKIEEAKSKVAVIEAMLTATGNTAIQQPLVERCEQELQSTAMSPTVHAQLKEQLESLNALLNKQFRTV
jgi:uncharacterized protein